MATFPDSVTLSKAEEMGFCEEFAPQLTMVCAAVINISKAKDFRKFAFLAQALDLILIEGFKSMTGPEN